MKIYHDNSDEILKSSQRISTIQRASMLIIVIAGISSLLTVILSFVFKAFDDFDAAKAFTEASHVFLSMCFLALLCWIMSYVSNEKVKIDNKSLCLIKECGQGTIAIISGKRDLYIDPIRCKYTLLSIKQRLKLGLSYGSGYAAYFVLKFYISPQALTDAGRHALMRDIKHKRTLKKSMLLWLVTGFQFSESGNLEITQEFLDKNPFGFCAMRIKFLKITQRTNNKIKVI